MSAVFRVQHKIDGRGPFRPGFTLQWSDDDGSALRSDKPPWMVEFGSDAIDRLGRARERFGSGCDSVDQITGWFSPAERFRLAELDYHLVRLTDVRILARSANQVLFARFKPLHVGAQIRRWP